MSTLSDARGTAVESPRRARVRCGVLFGILLTEASQQ